MNATVSFALASAFFLASGRAAGQEPPPRPGDIPPADVAVDRLVPRDTVVAWAGNSYAAGGFQRWLLGDLYRDLWDQPFEVGVLDLASVGGGLRVDELGGGLQTRSLHFVGEDGLEYQFRSIEKNARRALPPDFRRTWAGDLAQDQMAGQLPLGAMVVAELLRQTDVLVAAPRPVIVPDDPRLGELRELFAGRIGWIEARPNEREGDRPGWRGSDKIVGTDELYDKLDDDPDNYVDPREFLRARLVDFLVGDWDRHADQWRWFSVDRKQGTEWLPIPRDRDYAFTRLDGVVPWIVRQYWPPYVGFGHEYPEPIRYSWHGRDLDRRLLVTLERDDFISLADSVSETLTDSAIAAAVSVLPPSHEEEEGVRLRSNLRTRRDGLTRFAEAFYELLAGWVDLRGSEAVDSVEIQGPGDGTIRIRMVSPSASGQRRLLERVFRGGETREIRIYLEDGDDYAHVIGAGSDAPIVRVVGGSGADRFVNDSEGMDVRFYDAGDESLLDGPGRVIRADYEPPEDQTAVDLSWEFRDWGSSWVTTPLIQYDSDLGLYAGARLERYGFGFRAPPFKTRVALEALASPPGQWRLAALAQRTVGWQNLAGEVGVRRDTNRRQFYFGRGNESEAGLDDPDARTTRSITEVDAFLVYGLGGSWEARLGPRYTRRGAEADAFAFDGIYGTGEFQDLALVARLDWKLAAGPDDPDEEEEEGEGREDSGWALAGAADARLLPAALDIERPIGMVSLDLSLDTDAGGSAPLAGRVTVGVSQVWGDSVPYVHQAFLGGGHSLRGFEENRFAGSTAVHAGLRPRIQVGTVDLGVPLHVGLVGSFGVGRVFLATEESDLWHSAWGGGLSLAPITPRFAVHVTAVRGDRRTRWYLDFRSGLL